MIAASPHPRPPRRVLIIKPSSLGDVVTAIPVLRGLARTFPEAHISWLVTPGCAGILAGERDRLDEAIDFDRRRFGRVGRSAAATREFVRFCRGLRRRGFDWVLDLQGLFRSGFLAAVTGAAVRAGFANYREFLTAFYTHTVRPRGEHTVDRNVELARSLGIDARGEDLTLAPTARARTEVESALSARGLGSGRYVVAFPGTRGSIKAYPPRLWAAVLKELAGRTPARVVLAGTPAEGDLCESLARSGRQAVNLAGETTVEQLVALIAGAAAVVCCDSAANLIASATGTPCVTLIGPTRPERTGPYGPTGRAIVADIPCRGCLKRRCPHVTCMQSIEPRAVAAAVEGALAHPAAGATAGGASRRETG